MKRLIIFSIAAATLLLQPAFAQQPESRAAKIQELAEQYTEVQTALAGLDARADELAGAGYGGQVLRKDLRVLAEKIAYLKSKLKKLDAQLVKLGSAVSEIPKVSISALVNQRSALAKGGQVSDGDELTFSANVKFARRKEAVLSEVIWQLFDPSGNEKAALRRRQQFLEAGTEALQTYGPIKVSTRNLANGEYKVMLTHRLVEQPNIFAQDVFPFKLFQAVRIKKLVVTANPADQKGRKSLYNDEQPYVYVYYELTEGIDEVDLKLTVTDRQTGKLIASGNTKRKRKDGSNLQRAGFRLKKGRIALGSTADIAVTITAPDGKQVSDSLAISVHGYGLRMSLPRALIAGKSGQFRIYVPKVFKRPYRVDFGVKGGLIFHHKRGQLAGTITGITKTATIRPKFRVSVTDGQGRRAFLDTSVIVKPAPKPKPKPKIVVRPPPAVSRPAAKTIDCLREVHRVLDPERICTEVSGFWGNSFCEKAVKDLYAFCRLHGRMPHRGECVPGFIRPGCP